METVQKYISVFEIGEGIYCTDAPKDVRALAERVGLTELPNISIGIRYMGSLYLFLPDNIEGNIIVLFCPLFSPYTDILRLARCKEVLFIWREVFGISYADNMLYEGFVIP